MENGLKGLSDCDIIEDINNIFDDEVDEMSNGKYHGFDNIYVYGVFEKSVAFEITSKNTIKTPVILYETESAAKAAAHNLQSPCMLQFVLNVEYLDDFYDELYYGMDDIAVKKSGSVKNYLAKCGCVRKLAKLGKQNVIVYEVRNPKRIDTVERIY